MRSCVLKSWARSGDHTITEAGSTVAYNSMIVSGRGDWWRGQSGGDSSRKDVRRNCAAGA